MNKALSIKQRWVHLRRRLPRARAWVAVGALAGAFVLGFWGYLGVGYGLNLRQASSLDGEVARVSASIRQATVRGNSGESAGTMKPDQAEAGFRRLDSEVLTALLYPSAAASNVHIVAMVAGRESSKVERGVQYKLQPLNLSLDGRLEDVRHFLGLLGEDIPGMVLVDLRAGGFSDNPTAQLQLVLYTSPKLSTNQPVATK